MEIVNRNDEMPIGELLKNATQVDTALPGKNESDKVVGGDWWDGQTSTSAVVTSDATVNLAKPILPKDDVVASDEYVGTGVEISKDAFDVKPEEMVRPGDLSPETKDSVAEYLKEMNVDMAAAVKDVGLGIAPPEKPKDDNEDDTKSDEMTTEEFNRKYNEAVVVIDKTGMGTVINFTDAERAKLEKVKKIKLEEVEVVSLSSIRTKKAKKDKIDTILEKKANVHATPIVLPASGFVGKMKGCSTYELISLMGSGEDPLQETEMKWSLIHSKLSEASIGAMDFNEFLQNTAAVDYLVYIFGILCATYPDEDKLPLHCNNVKCGKEFDHTYSIKSLIRAEQMTDRMIELVTGAVDASYSLDESKAFHEASPVKQSLVIKLPVSGIIVELCLQSAYDFIYKSMKELSQNKDPKYNKASVLSSVVNKLFVPDEDDADGAYFEFDSPLDISKTIYTLGDIDNLILTKKGGEIVDEIGFQFGLMNVVCPYCKTVTQTLPMDLESILFYKYQQAMTTKIE